MSLRIVQQRALPPRDARQFPDRVEHHSPDGRWRLLHHNPREWRMGADGWDLSLFHDDTDVSSRHRQLFNAVSRGFRSPDDLQPWSPDSTMLGLLTWEEGTFLLYHLALSKAFKPKGQGYAFTLHWSPAQPSILVAFQDHVSLFGSHAEAIASAQWPAGKHELPFVAWWPSGQFFVAVGRATESAKIRLGVFTGDEARLAEIFDLDPLDLVPYESARYAGISRDAYSLHLRFGGGAGSLLDHWSRITFDPQAHTLALYTYRPTSGPYRQGNQLVCDAEERGVLVQLSA